MAANRPYEQAVVLKIELRPTKGHRVSCLLCWPEAQQYMGDFYLTTLTSSTARQLLEVAQSDCAEAEAAITRLLQANRGLCAAVARRFSHYTAVPYDDLFQEAQIAFVDAVRDHRPDAATLSTFAWSVMSRSLMKVVRTNDRRNREDVGEKSDTVVKVFEKAQIGTQGMPFDERYAVRDLMRASLDEKDRKLLSYRFWNLEPHVEIARRLGVTRAAIQKRQTRALQVLKAALTASR